MAAPAPSSSPTSAPLLASADDGAPLAGLFPAQPDGGVPVTALCLATGSPDTAVACPADPRYERQLAECQRAKCAAAFSNINGAAIPTGQPFALQRFLEAATTLEECSLERCRAEFWAASSTLCVPLDNDPLASKRAYLSRLPDGANATVFGPAFGRHLAARKGLAHAQAEFPQWAPSNATTAESGTAPPPSTLGVCAPTLPLGWPCSARAVEAVGVPVDPWKLPDAGESARPPKAFLATQVMAENPAFAASGAARTANASDPAPPFLLRSRAAPSDGGEASSALLISANLYSLSYCDAATATLVPSLGLRETCTSSAQCRFGICSYRGSAGACASGIKTIGSTYLGNNATVAAQTQQMTAAGAAPMGAWMIVQQVLAFVLLLALVVYSVRLNADRLGLRRGTIPRRLAQFWVGKDRTTTQREITLRPADTRMLDPIRRNALGGGTSGDALPRYTPVPPGETPVVAARVMSPPPPLFTSTASIASPAAAPAGPSRFLSSLRRDTTAEIDLATVRPAQADASLDAPLSPGPGPAAGAEAGRSP
ncbi:hypothetical protein H9P43_003730 [Blastocladiella emersonii ATCC 22665]|nr:hypothetical protein H9P43_003730 [Blastocladiella emersonii ATCC 22665]